jgi:hypothetical protein
VSGCNRRRAFAIDCAARLLLVPAAWGAVMRFLYVCALCLFVSGCYATSQEVRAQPGRRIYR